MITRKKLLAIGAIATSALLVTACAGGDEPEQTEDQVAEDTNDQAEETPEDTTDDDVTGDVTAPGTTLAIGDTAVLAHPDDSGEEGDTALLAATVTEIEEVTLDDLAELEMGDRLDGLVPYYIHITVAGVDESSEALAGTVLSNPFTGATAGSPAQNLNVIGSFEPCDVSSLDSEWGADSTQDICVISLVSEGSEVDSVVYAPSGSDYRNNPVLWE